MPVIPKNVAPNKGVDPGHFSVGYADSADGTGVNTNDVKYQETFPYVAFAQSGRDRVHGDPGEKGCAQGGGICPVQ